MSLASKIFARSADSLIGLNLQNVLDNFDLFALRERAQRSFDYQMGKGEQARFLRMHLAELKDDNLEESGYILTRWGIWHSRSNWAATGAFGGIFSPRHRRIQACRAVALSISRCFRSPVCVAVRVG